MIDSRNNNVRKYIAMQIAVLTSQHIPTTSVIALVDLVAEYCA